METYGEGARIEGGLKVGDVIHVKAPTNGEKLVEICERFADDAKHLLIAGRALRAMEKNWPLAIQYNDDPRFFAEEAPDLVDAIRSIVRCVGEDLDALIGESQPRSRKKRTR